MFHTLQELFICYLFGVWICLWGKNPRPLNLPREVKSTENTGKHCGEHFNFVYKVYFITLEGIWDISRDSEETTWEKHVNIGSVQV